MNNIGITDWQNVNTEYPLKYSGQFAGIFCDASFVVYDGVVPFLNSMQITDTTFSVTITFDDGKHTFTTARGDVVEGQAIILREGTRTYGTLVFGRNTQRLLNGEYGQILSTNCSFSSNTIWTIDSTNGVYSLNGLAGGVNIVLDNNFLLAGNALSAVSIPNNLVTVPTNPILYTCLPGRQLANIEGSSIAALDRQYDIIYNHNGKLIGFIYTKTGTDVFDLSTIPASKLLSLSITISAPTTDSSGNLTMLMNNSIVNLGVYPYSVPSGGIATGLNALGMIFLNGKYLIYTAGPQDYSVTPTTTFSNFFYTIDPSVLPIAVDFVGMITDNSVSPTNRHVPSLSGLYVLNGQLYGWYYNSMLYILNIDPDTLEILSTNSLSLPAISTIFVGGPSIIFSNVTALKVINGLGASDNRINIIGSDTFSVTNSGTDTITFNLPIDNSVLNVRRSIQYG